MAVIIDDPEQITRIIKKYCFLALGLLLLALLMRSLQAYSQSSEQHRLQEMAVAEEGRVSLFGAAPPMNICHDKKLGFRFQCQFGWEDVATDHNTSVYRIAGDPKVRFKVVKFDIDILYIEQLNKIRLRDIGHYADGFAVEHTRVAGFKAIKVKAFARDDAVTRLLDYYFVRDGSTLYALMFSVSPKSGWNDFQFAFRDIVESFAFE